MSQPRVLNVGQCGYDHRTISRHLETTYRAEVRRADTFPEAISALRSESFDLVLVNRVSDADGSLGVELIRAIKGEPALAALPVMLVSNYAEAQADAQSLGALPGFGKSDVGTGSPVPALDQVLAGATRKT